MKRLGILTGGGDCPGLNAVIRAVVRRAVAADLAVTGFRNGWAGVMRGETVELSLEKTRGLIHRGGTILGTSRTNPYREDGGAERVATVLRENEIDCLIAIGGEDTLGVANKLVADGIANVVGVPKTIDNDLGSTDFTFGFHTAVQIATDAIDRLHTTAESHNRVMVLEVMGRHAGWIAAYCGIAGGADSILVPERPFDVEDVCEHIRRRSAAGHTFSIVVVAEGAERKDGAAVADDSKTDAFGHARLGGIGIELEQEIEERTGFEARVTILGHIQRGGTPTAYDRVIATRFGVAATEAAIDGAVGKMVALQGTEIVRVPLEEALAEPKLLDPRLYETAAVFFG